MKPNVYIIIVTYNSMQWIDKCLQSTLNSALKAKVVVVDNKSSDATINHIQKNFPDVILLKNDKNLGFGQANNLGISFALKNNADHVFLLNQDAYLIDNALDKLVQFQRDNPTFGILSPIHTDSTQESLDKNFSRYVRFEKNPYFYSDFVLNNSLKSVYEVPFVNAAGWLLSRQCLLTVGGFDPLFFHYGEDDNFCQRVLYHQFKIGVLPKAFMIHDRDDRQLEDLTLFSEVYFKNYEKNVKVKYANVNSNNDLALKEEINRNKNHFLKSFFKLQFKNVKGYSKKIKLLKSIKPLIDKSIHENKKISPSYLQI